MNKYKYLCCQELECQKLYYCIKLSPILLTEFQTLEKNGVANTGVSSLVVLGYFENCNSHLLVSADMMCPKLWSGCLHDRCLHALQSNMRLTLTIRAVNVLAFSEISVSNLSL